jgi:hypothetical protein
MTDQTQPAPQISKCFGSLPKCECREIYEALAAAPVRELLERIADEYGREPRK